MSKSGFGRGEWCVVGDFNAVLHCGERKGLSLADRHGSSTELIEFGEFVRDMELVDLPVLGRKFTWFHSNGIAMSRIDRVLVSEDWLRAWVNPSLWVLPRSISDHCPLVLRFNSVDWGPRPFRFNNHWLLHKDFFRLVEEFWRNCNLTGWMAFILKEKLKGLKTHLREWNRETYGMVDSKIAKLISDINSLDIRSEVTGLLEGEVALRKNLFSDMWHLRFSKASVLAQRARLRWLREGDANSRYFHATINSRGKKNFIRALRVGEEWMESPVAIRQATVNFFKLHFASVQWSRPNLNGISFPAVLEADNIWLTRPFSMEEIEVVVKESDGNKSPGPDGFNFAFVKALWSIMKGEIRIMFDQFHGIGTLPKSFSSYFVALIPKVNSPFSLGDFRPISLLGCFYKIIAKVLTTRLARVMDSLVASTQSAFLKGRHLVDGVVVVNEIVDLARRTGQSCLILKVDFEKAYDS
ncbi:LINE-1 reverse transcriptase like, partial [Trifolium medium]|nr:LINE-1 reverse transcriptase like [Trifolium medium]